MNEFEFAVGDEVLFKGKRAKIACIGVSGLIYDIEMQPGSMMLSNVPSVMLSRPPIPPSPEDDPIARIEAGIANVNTQLKGIRELLSKRMPKRRTRR